MNIPLDPGDEVAGAATTYEDGYTVVMVVTRRGRVYKIKYDGPNIGWTVHAL